MPTIKDVTEFLEQLAPLSYQESYDNAGLIVGDASLEITGVLLSLDCIESVVEEAIAKKCNLIIAHHPIVFKGLTKLNGGNYVEKTILKAIRNDIAIYASHTNLDNVVGGVNYKIAAMLGLNNVKILAPKSQNLMHLVVFVPIAATQNLLETLYEAGAGQIGNYSNCSFKVAGEGSFRPNTDAKPIIGQANVDETLVENRIEVIFPAYLQSKILTAMKKGHIYEEVVYYLSIVNNPNQSFGSGAIGELPSPMSSYEFLNYLSSQMQLNVIKHTALADKIIQKVAICGGAGSFLLPNAIAQNADIFISSDFKYHEFFDAENKIIIADIGHYESEKFTKELLLEIISKKFTNFAVYLSAIDTNPIRYFINS